MKMLSLETGVGQIKKTGSLCGPHCQKQALHQESCFIAAARKVAKADVLVRRQPKNCTALCQCGGDCEILEKNIY